MTDDDKVIEEAKAEMLPYESWVRLAGESSKAFAAFCVFRDLGSERSVKRAVDSVEKEEGVRSKRYRMWRNWCAQFRWRERAVDFDKYLERLKVTEMRKTIEAHGEKQREVTGKLLSAVSKRLDVLNPEDLPLALVTDWTMNAIKVEREAVELVLGNDKPVSKQGELAFPSDFDGI